MFTAVKGHAQSSGAPTEVPSSLMSPLPEWKSESTTAPNSSVPTASSSQASIAENKTEQINDINSEEHNNSTTITEKTQIILEGFITGNDTVNLAPDVTEIESVKYERENLYTFISNESCLMSNYIKFTPFKRWNETTEIPQDLIRESDLSLSFISSSSHISAAASYLPSAGVAAIVAGILCTFGVVAYGGLIIWRRVLE